MPSNVEINAWLVDREQESSPVYIAGSWKSMGFHRHVS